MDESRRVQIEERIAVARRMVAFAVPQDLANDAEWLMAELKLRTESYNQCSTELRAANAKCDHLEQEHDTSTVLIADLKAQLAVSERISNDRNEARAAGLSEITQLRNDLANARQVADNRGSCLAIVYGERGAAEKERDLLRRDLAAERSSHIELLKRHQVTVADFNAACDERDSLRMKLETRTKSELPTKGELVNVMFSTREGDTVADKAQRVFDLLQRGGAVSPAGAVKNELPSIEEMHEQFDKGFEEAISETRGSNVYASDANGLRRVRDLIAARLGLTKQKPTKTETAAPVDKAQLDSAIGELLGRSKKLTLLSRFYAESGRTELSHNGSAVTLSDLRSLIGVLDR